MKPMARASLNGQPWSLFLLDTGSEPSMITRGGLRKTRLFEPEAAYPVTLEGIGKSRVSWGKISNVTVGVGAYMVRFKDIVVKEEADGIEDGILGASFLSPFDVGDPLRRDDARAREPAGAPPARDEGVPAGDRAIE